MKRKTNSGQALLIVLLSMAVVLIVVLSILARSVTDVSISFQDENSLRAFSAAEAGVEQALIIGSSIGTTEIGNASYNVEVFSVAEGEKEFNYPSALFSGESATIWFVAHDEEENYVCTSEKPCFTGRYLKVCWGKEGVETSSSTTPALELSVFYTSTLGDYSTVKIARETLDPNGVRRLDNYFSAIDEGICTISGINYQFQKTIDFSDLGILESVYSTQNGLQFMTIRSLYNTNQTLDIGVSVDFPSNSILPAQGFMIDSAGISGNANRKIEVFKSFGEIPDVFGFALFSSGLISK